MAFKDLRYVKINSANSLHLIIGRIDWYFEEINGHKYLALVPTDKNKEKTKKYEALWSKIKDLIRSKLITDLKFCQMKLHSSDNHCTMTPL